MFVCRECEYGEWDVDLDRFCPGCGRSAETHAVSAEEPQFWVVVARQNALPEDVAVCSTKEKAWEILNCWARGMKLAEMSGDGFVQAEDDLHQEWMFDIWGPRALDRIT